MRVLMFLLAGTIALAGCENTDDVISILNDVEIGVDSFEVNSTDPLDISVGLDIKSEQTTLEARLIGEWITDFGIGYAFYSDRTFGVMIGADEDWVESKFAGVYRLEGNNLKLIY